MHCYTTGMSPFKNIGGLGRRVSPREVIAKRKGAELAAVKEKYPAHKAEQEEKAQELQHIRTSDTSRVEKMADWILREEAKQQSHQEREAFYKDATSDENFYQNNRRKEVHRAIGEELRDIREHIEQGEDIEGMFQDGVYTYFDKKQVAQLLAHTIQNLEKNTALKEYLTSVLEREVDRAEEEDRIDRTIRLFMNSSSEERYRAILEPGAFVHFSQQDVVRRIVQSGSYFSWELLDGVLRSLYQEGKLEDEVVSGEDVSVFADREEVHQEVHADAHEEMVGDDADSEGAAGNAYANLLKRTDEYADRNKRKQERQIRQEHEEVDASLLEAVYGTVDVAEVKVMQSHRFRADNGVVGNDPYHMKDHRVNIYTATRAFRDLLEKSYTHITREEVAEKVRHTLEEVGDDTLYVAFRRAIRDLRRKEEYGLDYDTDGEDALIRIGDRLIEVAERAEIMHQWRSVFSRSFFNKESTQEFAHDREVCVREIQRMLTALLHREQPLHQRDRRISVEEYQRGLLSGFFTGVVRLQKGEYDHDAFFMKDYFRPEEVVAVLLRGIEEKEDQEMYIAVSEMFLHEEIDPMTRHALWARGMREAWQSLTRKSFLNAHQSQEFADGRKRQMQEVQDLLVSLVTTKTYPGRSLLYGGGFGEYHGYAYTTPKEVAAIALYAVESSGVQEAYDILLREIGEEADAYQETSEKVKEQERETKERMKERRVARQQQAKHDTHLKGEIEKSEEVAWQAVSDWKKRVGV